MYCGAAQCLEKVSERTNYYHFYFGGSFRNLKLEFTASFKKKTLLLFIPHQLINRHEIDLIWAGFRFDGIKKFASVHIFDNLKSIFYNMLIAGNHINPSGNVKYTYWSCRITLSVYLVSIQLIKTLTSIEHQAPEIEITHAIS